MNDTLQFIHIPKVAGESIEETYIEKEWGRRGGKFFSIAKQTTKLPLRGQCSFWHNHDNYIHKMSCKTFCVVRDPVDRIISSYKYGIPSKCGKDNSMKDNAKSLNRFINNLQVKLSADPFYYDNHFRPQHMFSEKCNHILLFENLEEELNKLLLDYNIQPKKLLHCNKPSRVFRNISKNKISMVNMQWIRQYYKKDFELLSQLRKCRE